MTPSLFAAIRSGNLQATALELNHLPITAPWPTDTDGHSILHWAAITDNQAVFFLVLQFISDLRTLDVPSTASSQKHQTPLHWACASGRLTTVVKLLEMGAAIDLLDAKGYSPATHAIHYGRVDVLHVLVKWGGSSIVHLVDCEGHGLLEWACYCGHVGVVVYLMRVCHVPLSHTNPTGMTPLHRAAQAAHLPVVDVLLRAGADVAAKNEKGQTPVEVADRAVTALLQEWQSGHLTVDTPVATRGTLAKYGLVVFYWGLLLATAFKVWEAGGIGGWLGLWWHVAVAVSIVSHLKATFGDPGDIEKGDLDAFVDYVQKVIENGTSETAMGVGSYCYICLAPRPVRSKHSRERDRCVMVFDHECPWVNNTVGLYTHKTLLLLVISTAFSQWGFIYAMVKWMLKGKELSNLGEALVERPLVCLLVLLHFCVSIFCVMLFLAHVRLVLRGQTTYEHLTAVREKRVGNPYDRGVWKNVISFLTSTGPGTGRPMPNINLREVVMSTGELQTADCATAEKKNLDAEEHEAIHDKTRKDHLIENAI